MNQFKVIIPSFNSIDYIRRTLSSVEAQNYRNFQAYVIDDGSTFPEQREVILEFCKRNGWKWHFHDKNYGALHGMVHALKEWNCDDDDVICVLDGDDWFSSPETLQILHKYYSTSDLLLTWGNSEKYPPGHMPMYRAQPVPDMVIDQQLYRDIPFVFGHLGTFKYFLWRQIKDEDLRDVNGEYFRLLKDKATMYPMLEMAGWKVKFIPEVLYIYNMENPLNDYSTADPAEFKRIDQILKQKPKYAVL